MKFAARSSLFSLCYLFLLAPLSFAEQTAQAPIINNAGETKGTITLSQGTEGVIIGIKAKDLPPGYHGMHFHSVGDCSDTAAFKSAAGHVDPHKKPHGFLNPQGPHEGNLPNLVVAADGSVEVELYSELVSLSAKASDKAAPLLDEDGSALIIHIDRDDHTSQPIGGSGARIACAELKN